MSTIVIMARVCSRLLLWLSCVAGAIGCGDALVGASCVAGYSPCDGECVNLAADYRHCGACGVDCGEFTCVSGACSDTRRVPSGDADVPDPVDASIPKQPYEYDAGMDLVQACEVGRASCPGVGCVVVGLDPAHCSGCGQACAQAELCSAGKCVLNCEAGLQDCNGGCVDLQTSSRHCGSCGRLCASGICEQGVCADAVPGHLVLLGHTYESSNPFQGALLGNAVFLGRGAPVRVLVFEGAARESAVAGAYAAIDEVAAAIGRAWQATAALEGLLTLQLESADVLVIHAQQLQQESVLRKLGESWTRAMAGFLVRGGVVVLLDGPSDVNEGTYHILEAAQLFTLAGLQPVATGSDLEVVAPGTGIAVRVGRRYRAERTTVGFVDPQTSATTVARSEALPVILHRVFD